MFGYPDETLSLVFDINITSQFTHSVLEDDDVAVLDLISRTGGDLTQARGISGSVARVPNVENYTRDGMQLTLLFIIQYIDLAKPKKGAPHIFGK